MTKEQDGRKECRSLLIAVCKIMLSHSVPSLYFLRNITNIYDILKRHKQNLFLLFGHTSHVTRIMMPFVVIVRMLPVSS